MKRARPALLLFRTQSGVLPYAEDQFPSVLGLSERTQHHEVALRHEAPANVLVHKDVAGTAEVQTGPLDEEVTLVGPMFADLQVSTNGTDADFVVKLIDVYPPDEPLPLANHSRVRLTIEPIEEWSPEKAKQAWEELKAQIREKPLHLGGKRYTRDELYERR